MYSKNDQAWKLVMLEWYLQLNISTTHPCQRRQENWSENQERFIINTGNWCDLFKKPKITTSHISHNATSFMPKGVSECVTGGSSSCTLLCPCLAAVLQAGKFLNQFTEKPPSWQKLWSFALRKSYKIPDPTNPTALNYISWTHKIIHFCLIATLKTPGSKKCIKSMKRVHCFGFPTPPHWPDQYLSAFLPVQPQSVVPLWYARHAANATIDCCGPFFFKKNLEGSQRHSRLRKKYLSCPRFFQETVRLSIPHLEFVAFVLPQACRFGLVSGYWASIFW